MNTIFNDYLRKFVLIFFNNILIYNLDFKSHLRHIRLVLELLQHNNFFIKKSKCDFATQTVSYLGHIISKDGISVEPSKIEVVVNWPRLTFMRALGGFLGLAKFYKCFIRGYVHIVRPLNALLCKENLLWNKDAKTTFINLKKHLTTMLVLRLLVFSLQFIVKTDASGYAMGVVLPQQNHPIAFLCRAFPLFYLNGSAYNKKMCSIIESIK